MKSIWLVGLLLIASGCSSDRPSGKREYMLQWYPSSGTDYGDSVPGFENLAMCRRAGSGKTIAAYGGLAKVIDEGTGQASLPWENGPWFECMSQCRPYVEGSYLLVCEKVVEFRGLEAISPR